MLEHEVSIEQNGFDLGEEGIIPVQVGPAGLHHANRGIGKVVHHTQKPIFGWNKIRVKDGDQFALGALQSFAQGAGLEALAVAAVQVHDVITQGGVAFHGGAGDGHGFVGGIVKHLNIKLVFWVIELANGLDQPVYDILLVKNRQLHCDPRQLGVVRIWFRGLVLLVLVIHVDQDVAVKAVTGQYDQHCEVGNEQGQIERIKVVEAFESLVEVVRADVLRESARGKQPQPYCAHQVQKDNPR